MVEAGPGFSVADVEAGWSEALAELGCDVRRFLLSDRLAFYASACRFRDDTGEWVRSVDEEGACRLASKGIETACFEWWPDVVLLVSCFYVPPDVLDIIRVRGMKVVILHTESPYEDERQLARAGHADLNLINDPTHIERFRSVAPTIYAPHAYRPALHRPGPVDPKLASDFVFVGTGYPSRREFLEAVDWSGVDAALAGNWQVLDEASPLRPFVTHGIEDCLDNADTVKLYNSAKASANLYRREADRPELSAGWSMGPREVELAACGTFFLREQRAEGDEVLAMVPTFAGAGDFTDKLRHYLAHDDERRAIAERARAAVADRTFTSNARTLLRHIDGLSERH